MLSFLFYFLYDLWSLLNFGVNYQFFYKIVSSLTNTYLNLLLCSVILFFCTNLRMFFFSLFLNFIYFQLFLRLAVVYNIPNQLIVGLNCIHPVLFYLSLLCGLILFTKPREISYITQLTLLLIGSLCLVLGGLWGLGNAVWGFFWVNDFIEIILLVFLLSVLTCFHVYNTTESKFFFILKACMLILYIFLLRWGFIFTRHNFFNFNSINNLFLLYLTLYFNNFFLFLAYSPFFFMYILFTFYLVIMIFGRYLKYRFFYVLVHAVSFSVFLVWVKFRENNHTIFSNQIFDDMSMFRFINNKISFYFSDVIFLDYKFFLLTLNLWSFYVSKFMIFFINIYTSYCFFFYIFLMLGSMYKIYSI